MTKGVAANIIFLSKLLKTAMVKLFLGFQGQKRLSQLLYGIHAAPLSYEKNSADNKIELIARAIACNGHKYEESALY